MKSFKYFILFSLISFVACDEFLDRSPGASLDEEKVFTVFDNAQRFQADIYSGLSHRFNALGSHQPVPMSSASDESESNAGYHGTRGLNMGNYDGTDANIYVNYNAIRKANLFLKNVYRIPFPDDEIKNKMVGEVYFLRAYYFNEVLKRFGGMPIMTEEELFVTDDNLMRTRNTYRECLAYIMKDLQHAIEFLPVTVSETEYGRATKGAALALKARMLLFAASPLIANRGGFLGVDGTIDDWMDQDNKTWWEKAALAAEAVIELSESDGVSAPNLTLDVVSNPVYALYSTTNDAAKKPDDYQNLFFKRRENGNKEIIFHKHEAPAGYDDNQIKVWMPNGTFGGNGAVQPTNNFVKLFEMNNGKYINEENSGYDPEKPYQNRDPRFYKIIIYQGSVWQGITVDLNNTDQFPAGTFLTGYFVRKYLPEEIVKNSTTRVTHNWIYFRLAEMYLNYAEALNEVEGPTQRVRDAINKVRARSGVVAIPVELTPDKKSMRERIQRERAVELCFEEHRWWDARRWSGGEEGELAAKWFGATMYKTVVSKSESGVVTYDEEPFYTRIYQSYNNFYQIPIGEMEKNPLFVQNPGY